MKEQSLDPNGMVNLFERLKAESSNNVPSILSTHPLPEERINYIQDLISKNKFKYLLKSGDNYVSQITLKFIKPIIKIFF